MKDNKLVNIYVSTNVADIVDVLSKDVSECVSNIDRNDRIISIFGSASVKCVDLFQQVEDVSNKLSSLGYVIMTGGGPGVMEAASKGAYFAGNKNYGINIELPHEQFLNKYVTVGCECNSMAIRKMMLMRHSLGFIFFSGGVGTLDELFELIISVKINLVRRDYPIILFGKSYWSGLISWIEEQLVGKFVSRDIIDMLKVVDSIEEVLGIFKDKKTSPPLI